MTESTKYQITFVSPLLFVIIILVISCAILDHDYQYKVNVKAINKPTNKILNLHQL